MAKGLPIPNKGIINPKKAKLGMVCITLATLRITLAACRLRVISMPNGTPMKMAMKTAVPVMDKCLTVCVSTSGNRPMKNSRKDTLLVMGILLPFIRFDVGDHIGDDIDNTAVGNESFKIAILFT